MWLKMEWSGREVENEWEKKRTFAIHREKEMKKCGARTCLKVDFGWHIDYALSPSIDPKKKTLNHQQQQQQRSQGTTTKNPMKNLRQQQQQQQQKVSWNFQQIFVNRLQHSLVVQKFALSLCVPLDHMTMMCYSTMKEEQQGKAS